MYTYIKYTNPFLLNEADEQAQVVTPQNQAQPLSGKNVDVLLTLSEQDQEELNDLLENNAELKLFTRPANFVDKMDPSKKVGEVNIVFAIADSDEKNAKFPSTESVDLQKSLVFNVYPKQISITEIASGPVSISLKVKPDDPNSSVKIIMVSAPAQSAASTQTQPEQVAETPAATEPAPTQAAKEPSQQDIALATGEMVGSNPKKYEAQMAIKSFDQFVGESKKKWIGNIDMKKGALKKELGDAELSAADIKKAEDKLAKKDKDKKKKGLQLNPKDAKTHKRLVLAKNLMKASGAISESRQEKIKGAKEQLIKIHEVIEKMIKKTSK